MKMEPQKVLFSGYTHSGKSFRINTDLLKNILNPILGISSYKAIELTGSRNEIRK
ncbi:hypothetical protein GCM10008915_76660 [Bifidobacterium pullorum subsp. gallinarum]|jgi:hypothetical protein